MALCGGFKGAASVLFTGCVLSKVKKIPRRAGASFTETAESGEGADRGVGGAPLARSRGLIQAKTELVAQGASLR